MAVAGIPAMPPSLDNRIQALPQELQDEILALVVATEPIAEITKTYKPPIGLSINRKIREKTAMSFFTSALVKIKFDNQNKIHAKWLSSMDAAHLKRIKAVRMVKVDPLYHSPPPRFWGQWSTDTFGVVLQSEFAWVDLVAGTKGMVVWETQEGTTELRRIV